MAVFPASARENAPAGATPALRVSTKYMENFLPLRPVSSGTEIHTCLNEAGAIDIYSVGTDQSVYRLRRSEGQAAPFNEVDLGIQASQLYFFAPSGTNLDTPSIFGLDSKGKLTLATWEGEGYLQSPSGPQEGIIRHFLGVRGVTGRIYINVRLSDGALASNYYDPLTQQWGGSAWAPVKGPDGKDAKVKDIATAANNPVQSALFAIGMDDEVLFAEDSFRTSQLRSLGKKASHIAAIADAEDLLNIFAVELNTGLLWVKRQRKYSTGGIQFEDWVQVSPAQSTKLGRLYVNLRRDQLIEVFALDEAGDMRYTHQSIDKGAKVDGWLTLFPITSHMNNAIFAVGRDANGYSEAFSVTLDNDLYRFWQAPETGQWFSELLDVPQAQERLISVATHATEITAVDGAGLPLSDVPVTINAAFIATLWVDGIAYRSSIADPVSVRTGAAGKVVILQRANALAGAPLLVATPRTVAGQPIKVEPNAQLQARLSDLTREEVLDAKDKSGQPLLPPDTKDRERVAESIAQITRRSMDIAQAEERASAIQYKYASLYSTGFQARTSFASLGETAWEIDFTSGVPIFHDTTLQEVDAFRAEHAHLLSADGSFLGIDWGSVWDGIKNAVGSIIDGIEKIIVTVVNGIATVLFKIAGKIFEAVLQFAQQAFDFIEGVWNYLKVKLKQLYEWLAFLFDFEDFARTAEGIKHTVGVILDFSVDAVGSIRSKVDEGFNNLKKSLDTVINDYVAYLNEQGQPALGSAFEKHTMTPEQEHANDHNVFGNAFDQNYANARNPSGAMMFGAAEAQSPLQPLLDKLLALTENFQFGDGKQAFEEAFGYFDNIGSDPSRALQLFLSGLVKAFEGVALFALDFAKGVVDSLLDLIVDVIEAFKSIVFEQWEIPVVSQLYELFTGKKLTLSTVDIAAWIIAVPGTILSKVVLGRAPWNAEQLKAFEQYFTADMLKKRLDGLSAAQLADAGVEFDQKILRDVFLGLYAATMVARGGVDSATALLTAGGVDPDKEKIGDAGRNVLGGVSLLLRFCSTGFTAPWALSPTAGAPSCKQGTEGFGVTTWICQCIFGPTRGAVCFFGGLLSASPEWKKGWAIANQVTVSIWGAAHLGMQIAQFVEQEKTDDQIRAFTRNLTNLVPGQLLRFLCLGVLNRPAKYIPVAVLVGVSVAGESIGSAGCAIAEIVLDSQSTELPQEAVAAV